MKMIELTFAIAIAIASVLTSCCASRTRDGLNRVLAYDYVTGEDAGKTCSPSPSRVGLNFSKKRVFA